MELVKQNIVLVWLWLCMRQR